MDNRDQLVANLLRCKLTLDGLDELLGPSILTPQNNDTSVAAKRKFILESFALKSIHTNVQKLQAQAKLQFVSDNVKPYNQKLVHLVRLDAEVNDLQKQLDSIKKIMFLPDVSLSPLTLREALNGKYSEVLTSELQTAPVLLLQIFSLSPESALPKPVYEDFENLLNVELKTRLLLQIKYELLLQIKSTLLHRKSEWVTRDERLKTFIDGLLAQVLADIGRVRATEIEDGIKNDGTISPANDVSGSVSAVGSDDEAPNEEMGGLTEIDEN